MKENLCILTSNNLRNGGKQTRKCMPPFNDRDSWTSCLLHLLQNHPYPEGFPPRSLLPAIQLQLLHLLSFLKDFVLIKSVSLRGLYSIIICQIPIKLVSFR